MTERTIRSLSKELAGQFYEDRRRSGEFRDGEDLVVAYTDKQFPDGSIREVPVKIPFKAAYPNVRAYTKAWWPHFIGAARKMLVAMLSMPDAKVSPTMKEAIAAALIEDHEKQLHHGKELFQTEIELPHEYEKLPQSAIDDAAARHFAR